MSGSSSGADMLDSVTDSIGDGYRAAARGLDNASQSIREGTREVAATLGATADDAATATMSGSSGGLFGSLNSVLSRVAFVFLLLVGFYLLGSLCVAVLGWYTRPDRNPVLISGRLSGGSAVDITQDPKKTDAILVARSNNRATGAEFSWAVWLFLNARLPTGLDADAPVPYSTIFTKGVSAPDPRTGVFATNGPGMYVRTNRDGSCELGVAMDTVGRSEPDWIRIPNMPIEAWVHVLVRLENMEMKVYVNGTVAASHPLSSAPRQNYYDVKVCPNGGFAGWLSDLRYFDHAVPALRMRALLARGVTTSPSTATADASKAGGTYTYLSDMWYR